jgi:hypothetical protein
MNKFKVGDRVRRKVGWGKTDMVESVPGDREYDRHNFIDALDGFLLEGSRWEYQRDWELDNRVTEEEKSLTTKPKNMIQKISSTLKRVLSASMQAQYKAGFRNGDLALTEKDRNELLELLAAKHEKELTDVAKEIIKEEEDK